MNRIMFYRQGLVDLFYNIFVLFFKEEKMKHVYVKNNYARDTNCNKKQTDKIFIKGIDKQNKQILLHSFSTSGKSIVEKLCPDLQIKFNSKIVCNSKLSISYEHYEWIDCNAVWMSQIVIYGVVFQLGKKFYHDVLPLENVRHFFRNKLDWLPWCRTDGSWILMDRDTQADDNAEHLYRWLRRNHPELKIFFALRRTSHDWRRLEAEGFALLDITSPVYLWRRLRASVVASSHADNYIFMPVCYTDTSLLYTFLHRILHRIYRFIKKDCIHIFLQHGVTMNNLAKWLNRTQISLFITETPAEFAAITGNMYGYRFTEKDVALAGFPRHDALAMYAGTNPTRPQITFMPTWRRYLLGEALHSNVRPIIPDFMQSTYARTWQSLLAGERLRFLQEKYGFDVVFFPHANMQPYLPQFVLPHHVRIASHAEVRIQDVFRATSLLVTDYSSVAFEEAFLMRPVIYYQFDAEKFFSGDHVFTKGYFSYKKDGFGPVVRDENQLLYEIEKCIISNYKLKNQYFERIKNTYIFQDSKNCIRVYESIIKQNSIISA